MFSVEPAITPSEPQADAYAEGCRRRVARLEALSDELMAMTRTLPKDGSPTTVESMVKLARGVRLTTTLEATLHEGLVSYLVHGVAKREDPGVRSRAAAVSAAKGAVSPDEADEDPYAELKTGAKGRARELVKDVVDRDVGDPEEHDDFLDALDERLIYDDAYTDIEGPPIRDIVEHLCHDLMLKPDWSLWEGDGWKPKAPFQRYRSSMFKDPSRRAILGDDLDPDPGPDPFE